MIGRRASVARMRYWGHPRCSEAHGGEIMGAAARAGDKDAMRSTAKLIITMDLESLRSGDEDGGYAVTATGRVMDAGTARRFACSADLIPAVLGGDSAPLDVGRQERAFAGGLRAAIILRDKQCTFPGMGAPPHGAKRGGGRTRPPGWCEGHHIIPWWAGGETTVSNGALLCVRHHHVVHSRGYLANVTPTGVIWDLTPGRMAELRPHGRDDAA